METVEAHVGKMQAELERWGARLDDLVAKADAAGTGAKIDYRARLEDAMASYDIAKARFAELKASGNDKWETLRGGIEAAWSDLEDNLKKLARKKG